MPSEQSGQPHQTPPTVGTSASQYSHDLWVSAVSGEQRDRQRDQRVRQIELIVAIVERVVSLLILLGLQPQLLFLLRLIGDQRFVRRDRGAVALLLRGRRAGRGQLQLRQRVAAATSWRMLRAW